jgi:hypothetical protein
MPHLAFHMTVARGLANNMRNPVLDAHRGDFYLGSTGPDARILSRADRMSSHYFDLDCLDDQDAPATFFEAHADLRDAARLDDSTAAFVAGYLTHLVVDAVWIIDVYRPCFGPGSPLGGDAKANVLDRVLQYDMDLRCRKDRPVMEEIRGQLQTCDLAVHVYFLHRDILARWRDVVVDMISRPADWERFTKTASRFLAFAGVSTEEQIAGFTRTLPSLLQETKSHVGDVRMKAFLEKADALTLKTLEEYLS